MAEEQEQLLDAMRKERRERLVAESRLSLPTPLRLVLATSSSFAVGLGLGLSHGAQMAGLRFRAENAHRLPKTETGWYLYHKSKNYHMALAGVKEGLKMGLKLSVWTGAFFALEGLWDEIRRRKDFLNTTLASLTVAGGFSLWSKFRDIVIQCRTVHCALRTPKANSTTDRFPIAAAARTAKTGLAIGLAFGLTQDAVGALRGRRPGYVDFILRRGKRATEEKPIIAT
jgi:hypothetical protein